jgi:hypothetical protein
MSNTRLLNLIQLTSFHEIWRKCYATGGDRSLVLFDFLHLEVTIW